MVQPQEFGRRFQRLVESYLIRLFGYDAVCVPARPNNSEIASPFGDGGRDVEVLVPEDWTAPLFGVRVRPGELCLVEAKYVGQGAADFARTAPNLARMQNLAAGHVFVVTNAHFAPSAQVDIAEAYPALRGRIHLIEGRAFQHWCGLADIAWPDSIAASAPAREHHTAGLAIEANATAVRANGNVQTFSMAFRNLSDEERTVEVLPLADEEWMFGESFADDEPVQLSSAGGQAIVRTLIVPPWQSRAARLMGRQLPDTTATGLCRRREKGEEDEGARIVARVGGQVVPLFQNIKPIRLFFRPPFAGEHNKALCSELQPLFEGFDRKRKPATLQVVHVHGGAGVGKSRLVHEFLPPEKYASILLLEHVVEAGRTEKEYNAPYWAAQRVRLREFCGDQPWLKRIDSLDGLVDAILGPVQQECDLQGWGVIILVIEDLHNASETLCSKIDALVAGDHRLNIPVFLVLTARDDDTFENRHYRALAVSLPEAKPGQGVAPPIDRKVLPLAEAEAKEMIADLIEGISPQGVARIFALSGCIPHHIVQCIEYLLDASLVAVTHRDTLSIVDLRTFDLRSAKLPDTMEELFALRFEALGVWMGAHGRAAQEAVLAATWFGTRFPTAICSLVDGVDADALARQLEQCRFFSAAEHSRDGQLSWHHENLLLYFGGLRREKAERLETGEKAHAIAERFPENAALIRAHIPVWEGLDPLTKGAVATLLGDWPMAADYLGPVVEVAARVETFATLDAQVEIFPHIEYAVSLVNRTSSPRKREALWKMIVLKAFIGAYHLGLRHEAQAYAYGMRVLPYLDLPEQDAERCRLWLRTVDAQIHLDSGFVGAALDRLMHLVHHTRLREVRERATRQDGNASSPQDADMMFDIHNTLRLLFTYCNFSELADYNGRLATKFRELSGKKDLADMDLGDEALFELLTDRRKCIALLEQAMTVKATKRHAWHCEVSLIAARLPDQANDSAALQTAAARAEAIIATCREESYHSILPRIYLLRATIEYLMGRAASPGVEYETHMDQALAWANRGQGECEAYSIGFITWQLSNLKAVLRGRRDEWGRAFQELETAVQYLKAEGLFFMGTDGLISAAPIVLANYLSVASKRIPDSRLLRMLGMLRGFETYPWGTTAHLRAIRRQAKTLHHIIPEYTGRPDWLIVDDRTNLALVCWF